MKKYKKRVALAAVAVALGILAEAQMGASAMLPSHRHTTTHTTVNNTTSKVKSQSTLLEDVKKVLDSLPETWTLGCKKNNTKGMFEAREEELLKLIDQAISKFREACNNFDNAMTAYCILNTQAYLNVVQVSDNVQNTFLNAIGDDRLYYLALYSTINSELLRKEICRAINDEKKFKIGDISYRIGGKKYFGNLAKILKEVSDELNKSFPTLLESVEPIVESQASSSSSSSPHYEMQTNKNQTSTSSSSSPLSSPKSSSSSSDSHKKH